MFIKESMGKAVCNYAWSVLPNVENVKQEALVFSPEGKHVMCR